MPRIFSFFTTGELHIFALTVLFQIVSMVTLLRVATGIASFNSLPPPNSIVNSTAPAIVVPKSINENVSVPNSTPQFQNPTGNGLDASFLLALAFVGANVVMIGFLAYLYRRKRMKLFSLVVSLFMIFNVTELYFSFIVGLYSVLPVLAALAGTALTIVAAFRGMSRLTNALALLLALELGSSFPVLLQAPLNWIIPGVYAVFDIYAIYYGRLGKLVRQVSTDQSKELTSSSPTTIDASTSSLAQGSLSKSGGHLERWRDFGLLSVSLGDMEIGMADLAFYAMVPAVALILKSLFAFFVVMLTVDAGLLASFKVFGKKEVSPGLPIPILSGLAGLLIISYLL